MTRIDHYQDPNAPRATRLVPAASTVVVDNEGRLLMAKRTDNELWTIPGGGEKPGETIAEAAVREVKEETGIDGLTFEWGDGHYETGPYSRGKVARYYLASTTQLDVEMGISPETGEPEHHEWRWVGFDEAHDISTPRVRNVVRWARQIIGA